MNDFIIVPRELFRDESLSDGKYSRREAFLDLIQQATFTDEKEMRIKGGMMTLQRGQLVASIRFLALRWGWCNSKVMKVLDDWVKEQRIEHLNSLITILNYESFQGNANAGKNTESHKSNKDNNKKKEISDKSDKKKEAETVDRLYALYPSKTYRGERGTTSTGKCGKDRVRIAYLLKTYTPEQIERSIQNYIEETGGRFMKNFSTFLNNMPEDDGHEPQQEENDEYAHYE